MGSKRITKWESVLSGITSKGCKISHRICNQSSHNVQHQVERSWIAGMASYGLTKGVFYMGWMGTAVSFYPHDYIFDPGTTVWRGKRIHFVWLNFCHKNLFVFNVPYRTKFRWTKVPKIWLAAENFVRRKIFSAENFVRRKILSAEKCFPPKFFPIRYIIRNLYI